MRVTIMAHSAPPALPPGGSDYHGRGGGSGRPAMNVVLRYHEIALKGRNRPFFVDRLAANARRLTADLGGRVQTLAGRLRLELPDDVPWPEAERRLRDLFGVANFSRAREAPLDLEA